MTSATSEITAPAADPSAERRRLLGAFLRRHRERLTPAEAGLQGGSTRRRTPGLRREELAQLCGISPTWYSWLEQGRDVSVSSAALARLAEALHLTTAERAYLFEMTRKRDPDAPPAGLMDRPPPSLLAALEAMTAPAYLLDRLWTAVGWNPAAERLFGGWLGQGGTERNLLRYVFLDPTARSFILDWDNRARRLLAEFRAETARHPEDPAVQALVAGLRRESTLFSRMWEDHGVLEREGGLRRFDHPLDGPLTLEQLTLRPGGRSAYTLVMLLEPAESAA
ncbi:helix-turn-helix transcriptional regulator [Azospirillum sp. CT11-132]|jgi:transcriptional regulator with XRE-family HTH domain|uniref:helix-turn-helix transcriptional regulator n=1 Tax=unclassified Azospirillum TaxID=2630922 RepID=UPI000D61B078|nr:MULTISPECIES: helix-turn-helix transcriptional regulator [unclassified Azospirillum]PWC62409.1 DNA-binding protein [Azospirillum sp. TSH7]PWC65879.1 DNA-binding protein [Azospirillum sp. TSH20]